MIQHVTLHRMKYVKPMLVYRAVIVGQVNDIQKIYVTHENYNSNNNNNKIERNKSSLKNRKATIQKLVLTHILCSRCTTIAAANAVATEAAATTESAYI